MRKPHHHSSFVFYAMIKVARQCAHTRQMCALYNCVWWGLFLLCVLQCRTLCNGNAMGKIFIGPASAGPGLLGWCMRRQQTLPCTRIRSINNKQKNKQKGKYPKYINDAINGNELQSFYISFCLVWFFHLRAGETWNVCLVTSVVFFFFCYVSIVVCCCPIKLPLFIILIIILIYSSYYFLNIIWIKWIVYFFYLKQKFTWT